MASPLDTAMRLVGEVSERPGLADHPFILWCLESCDHPTEVHDEIPWCSGFVNRIAWLHRLPRSKSLAARSWLGIGTAAELHAAIPGFDVIVLKRGTNPLQGHVGWYAGRENDHVLICGGNQSNDVTVASFPADQVIGVRRLV